MGSMRAARIVGLVAVICLLVPPAAALAGSGGACPPAASGWERVDVDEWWDRTVAGFAEEGITVYDAGGAYTTQFDEFAASVGFGDGAGLETFVRVEQWAAIDKNDNAFVCIKDWPNTNGTPGYFFGGVDDNPKP
jgi:hypothetical protein